MQPHYFLALPLPTAVKELLSDQVLGHKQLMFKRWVHKEDLHLTLVFLGACSNEEVDLLKNECERFAKRYSSFSLSLDKLGTFGRSENPRIFWVGVSREPKLHTVQAGLTDLCEELGFLVDKRPFSPHITLARKWDANVKYYPATIDWQVQESWHVKEFVLYKSVVTEEPKYKRVATFSFDV